MSALAIVFANFAVLAGAVFGVVRSGQRPQVLLYAFVVDYGLRLFTIEALTGSLRDGGLAWLKPLVPLLSSPPAAEGRASYPLIDEQTKRSLGLGGYVIVTAFLAVLAFVFGHVTAQHQVEIDLMSFVNDLRWAAALGLVYWLQSLASRTIVIDPNASRAINFGFSTRDLTVFALAILTAGGVVAFRQINGKPPTGWVVLGPLLAFRFVFDLAAGLRVVREAR